MHRPSGHLRDVLGVQAGQSASLSHLIDSKVQHGERIDQGSIEIEYDEFFK
jgi:hypothetical protein